MELSSEELVKALKALAEPKRLEILKLIIRENGTECNCTRVLKHFDVAQSTLSHHISELREAGLIHSSPSGRTMLLTPNQELLAQISKFFQEFTD